MIIFVLNSFISPIEKYWVNGIELRLEPAYPVFRLLLMFLFFLYRHGYG